MPYLFECPQCGSQRTIADAAVGHRVRCPACEALVEITQSAEEEIVDLQPGAIPSNTTEFAWPMVTGVAISTPSLQPDWNVEKPVHAMPGVPVLAMADDEEDEEPPVALRSNPEQSEMDMTPMVDVTFQLLIFFMVTASFTMQKSLEIPAPKEAIASAASKTLQDYQEDPDFVTVRIDQNSTFHVTGAAWTDEIECPSEQELLAKLRESRSGSQGGASKMLVVAHGDSVHERVVTAIDCGITAGIDDVQLLSVEDDEANY